MGNLHRGDSEVICQWMRGRKKLLDGLLVFERKPESVGGVCVGYAFEPEAEEVGGCADLSVNSQFVKERPYVCSHTNVFLPLLDTGNSLDILKT